MIGQVATSFLAWARIGCTALTATMSSHEMWLDATSAPRPASAYSRSTLALCTSMRTPNDRAIRRNHQRTAPSRPRLEYNGISSARNGPVNRTATAVNRRQARRARLTDGVLPAMQLEPQGDSGCHRCPLILDPPGRT